MLKISNFLLKIKSYFFINNNSFIVFLKEFFSKKTNIIFSLLFLFLLLFLTFSYFLVDPNINEPISKNFIFSKNLPPSFLPIIQRQIIPGDESLFLTKIKEQNPDFYLTFSQIKNQSNQVVSDYVSVSYNAYGLLKILDGFDKKVLLGTNQLGQNNYSRLIISIFEVFILAIFVNFFQIIISIFIGSFLALYFKKTFSKISLSIYKFFLSIPFLLISILLFSFISFNFWSALLIFSIISSFSFVFIAYNKAKEIMQEEFFISSIALGYSKLNLITKVLFWRIFFDALVLLFDNLIMIFLTITTMVFLNVNNINNTNNIGSVLKDALELAKFNPLYISVYTIIFCSLLFLTKIVLLNIHKSQVKKQGVYNE
ncbi:ABC transporter permease subunit [Mycoplasmopsis pulmonis]|uniref:ABC transporter permease subunit n=1 Tax=Mycoplasmopsis pulmonis TaxID=2107 RepID=UPI002ACD8157|nr:ABC transporter permease subunit [Mycoplasmopsis pulmonis]MDZ7293591.1 ABC transporter permease subunit [Mycoplasmopsis pulmonis]